MKSIFKVICFADENIEIIKSNLIFKIEIFLLQIN